MIEKKRTDPDWQDIRTFLALARHGSLSAAARALSVGHATVARRLRSLEVTLGERLVVRRPDGYALTAGGTRVLEAASKMEVAIQRLEREDLGDGSPRGLVRVNASPALSHGFLIHRIAELPKIYRGLDIELATDIRSVSLDRHVADIAIRFDRPEDGDFIARPLGIIKYGFYGTPQACKAAQKDQKNGKTVFIGFDEASAHVPEAMWLMKQFPDSRIAFRANSLFAQSLAALSGVGLAMLPHYIGKAQAGLCACRLRPEPLERNIWLLTRPNDRKNLAVRTVSEYLIQLFEREQALFDV